MKKKSDFDPERIRQIRLAARLGRGELDGLRSAYDACSADLAEAIRQRDHLGQPPAPPPRRGAGYSPAAREERERAHQERLEQFAEAEKEVERMRANLDAVRALMNEAAARVTPDIELWRGIQPLLGTQPRTTFGV